MASASLLACEPLYWPVLACLVLHGEGHRCEAVRRCEAHGATAV